MAKEGKEVFVIQKFKLKSVGRWILNQGFCDLFPGFMQKK